ncbi:MAG: hypothetical protein LDL41_10335 [Coleofasciculus sp. S288]|nr:hypothetical protein [Coleofasciculus sp. S288]
MKNLILRQISATAVATVVALTGGVRAAFGQAISSSTRSMEQAGLNAGYRLRAEGYDLYNIKNTPQYHTFMPNRTTKTVSVDVPTTGQYILLVGGDDDTQDLDIELHDVGSDTTSANTGFILFNVYKPGRFLYDIQMVDCRAPNCGVFAVLLTVN